jgi:kynureninase
MAHAAPFAFEESITYADGAARFLHGSPAVPALYAAESGYKVINEIGVERIRAKSVRQTQRLIELAEEAGLRVTSPHDPARRGGTITVAVEHAPAVTSELIRREIIVDYRPGAGIRVAPHFYNSDEECDRALQEIKNILAANAWKRHAGKRTHVT